MKASLFKYPLVFGIQCLFLSVAPAAIVIDFESDTVGQPPGGWDFSQNGTNVQVVSTTSEGDYVGGKAIRSMTAGGVSFAGYFVATTVPITGLQADFRFDNVDTRDPVVGVFGFKDVNENGEFSGTGDLGFGFGARAGAFNLNPNSDGFASGINHAKDTWYRLTFTWGDPDVNGDRAVSLAILNLSADSTNVGTYNTTMTAAEFGFDPSEWDGVGIRMTRGTIDNITIIPEPTTALLGGLGLLALLRRRRA